MSLRAGTSGWAYPEWRPAFYPPGLPRERFLAHYASRLGMCEVNGTFYRLQSPAAVAAWAEAVPEGFRFVCKVHRGVTHAAGDPPADLARRFAESLAPLGPALGGVIAKVPPQRPRDDDWLDQLLEVLAPVAPVAVEFNDASWFHAGLEDRLATAGGTVCVTDVAGDPPPRLPAGPMAYVRLRADAYTDAQREAWAQLLGAESAGRPAYAVARHKDLPPDDPHRGLGLALWLSGRES